MSLQLQSGSGLGPVWRRRKPLVLQLLLLQQETEEDCIPDVPLHQVRSLLRLLLNATSEALLVFNGSGISVNCSVLSGYGRNSLDNELDMELDDDEEEMDGFTEDR